MAILFLFLFFIQNNIDDKEVFLPVSPVPGSEMQLTEIGQFGLLRLARPNIPAHLHTGIDIKRPSNNYNKEFIYPITKGKIISKRDDGAYAQLIMEHVLNGLEFWTVYEHIAGILVTVGDSLDPHIPIARFMNREELNQYGWQFDHLHLEILKIKPIEMNTDQKNPLRFFMSYTLGIYTKEALQKHFYNPIVFFKTYLN